jgi:hypothetical protein
LIKNKAPNRSDSLKGEKDESAPPASTRPHSIDAEQFCEALFRSLREGSLQPMTDALHLPSRAAQRLVTKLGDAIGTNVFGLHLGINSAADSSVPLGIPRARAAPSTPLSFERVDRAWVQRCLKARIENPALAATWSIVLRGLDPRSGQVAVRSDQEFITLLNCLPSATAQTEDSRNRFVVVVHRSVSKPDQESIRSIIEGTASKGCQMNEKGTRPPKGWALAGAVVETVTTGRRQIAALAFLAIASELLSK